MFNCFKKNFITFGIRSYCLLVALVSPKGLFAAVMIALLSPNGLLVVLVLVPPTWFVFTGFTLYYRIYFGRVPILETDFLLSAF